MQIKCIWPIVNSCKVAMINKKMCYLALLVLCLVLLVFGSSELSDSDSNSNSVLGENKSSLSRKDGFDDESDDNEEENSNTVSKDGLEAKSYNNGTGSVQDNRPSNKTNNTVAENSEDKRKEIENEIEIIRSKLFGNANKDDFIAKDVYAKLFELFEPASNKKVNFLEINKNLTSIIDNSNSQTNIGDSYGVLTYLWLYGIPDRNGKLEFPYGWPRNIDISIRYAIKGATKYRCGFCYTTIGMLFAWGYPPLVNNTHGWLGFDGVESGIDDVNTSFKNIYFLYQSSYKYGNYMNNEIVNFPRERSGFDLVAMNYALASKNKDIFGQLASSYYLRYGLSDLSYTYEDLKKSSSFSIHRNPYNLTSQVGTPSSSSRCIVALEPLIYVASKTLNDNNDLFLPDVGTILREREPKEHETKHYAEWVRSLAADRDPDGLTSLGELYYYGHEAGGIARNVNRAAQLWEESARRGDPQGALARAFLNLDGTIGTERDSAPYLRQVSRNGEPAAAALANYYIYKLGLDVNKNSTIAGEYLKLAADLGDGNAQLILAHAYAGGNMGVIPPGGQNETLALKYYKLSAEGGRTVAYFNSAVLTLKGSDKKYKTEESRCMASVDYLTHVVSKNNHVKLLGLLSKKSYENGDIVGSLLREMTLSEMGIMESHINARDLWKERSISLFSNGFSHLDGQPEGALPLSSRNESLVFSQSEYCDAPQHSDLVGKLEAETKNECKVETDKNAHVSTQYPCSFDMYLSGYSGRTYCYVNLTRNNVFFNVPVNFDNSLSTIGSFNFKYFDPYGGINATRRGELDVSYTQKQSDRDKIRVSDFLYCWMRPESYYFKIGGNNNPNNYVKADKIQFGNRRAGSYIDKLLYMWIKPYSGSYRRYPKPWYKSFRTLINTFRKLYNKSYLNNWLSRFNYLEDDIEVEKRVPDKYHILRNSSLWCSHYYAKRSSSNGDIHSTHSLSHHYLEGSHGTYKSDELAFKYIMRGVNSRDPKSILDYAIALYGGIGTKQDKSKSYRLLWHILLRGPYEVDEILPKLPKGPKFVPTISDKIREAIMPLMKNNTSESNHSNLADELFNSNNRNKMSSLEENYQNEGMDGVDDFHEDGHQVEDERDEDTEDDMITELVARFGIRAKRKIPAKNRKARQNDSINNMLRAQNEFVARVSSASMLALFTLDWILCNYVYHFYSSSQELKNHIKDMVRRVILGSKSEDEASEDEVSEDEEGTVRDFSDEANYSININMFISRSGLFGLISNKTYHQESLLNVIDNIARKDGSGEKANSHYDEDHFPLSSRFRYLSDEEYIKASNIWKASIPTRIYYFILRIVLVISIISILIPINIAITEKMNS